MTAIVSQVVPDALALVILLQLFQPESSCASDRTIGRIRVLPPTEALQESNLWCLATVTVH